MKRIIVDASTLISISQKCMIKILRNLAEKESIQFVIPETVYYEAVQHPLEIKRFELNAIRIRGLIDSGHIVVQRSDAKLHELIAEIEKIVNTLFYTGNRNLQLIQKGEAEALAVAKYLNANILAIDERTTRMLIERPKEMMKFLSRRHHTEIKIDKHWLKQFQDFVGKVTVIRSTELVAFAYESGCFSEELPETRSALEAALFAVKYAGCAVSADELMQFMNTVK